MRDLLQTKVRVALPAMIAIQSFGTMCGFAGAGVAVQAAQDLGVKSTYIGIYTATLYVVAMVSGLGAGVFLGRFGVIRTSQFALLSAVLGLWIGGAVPTWPAALAAAVLIGLGQGPQNPAGSRILARHTPPRWHPLVFSIKQTGTPMGGMLAGVLLPPLMALYDWRIAIATIAILPLLTMISVQSVRTNLDDDRDPNQRINLVGVAESLLVIFRSKALLGMALAGLLYTFVQMAIISFIVIFFEEAHGHTTEFAGGVFAVIHASAIPARILWGTIAGRFVRTWTLLGLIGIIMAASCVAIAAYSPSWSFWLTAMVAVALGASINGVLGLLLSEFARLAPDNKVGETTGGAQFFLFLGIVTGPPAFGAIVEFGGGYENAFLLIAAASLLAGLGLLLTAGQGSSTGAKS